MSPPKTTNHSPLTFFQFMVSSPNPNHPAATPTQHLLLRHRFLLLHHCANFLYTPILHPIWQATPPLHFPIINPLLDIFHHDGVNHKIIIIGGVRFIESLVDLEDRLDVEIYDLNLRYWKLGPPLPSDFRFGNSSSSFSSSLFKGRFYVSGIYSCFVSSFDLHKRVWSEGKTLRPPGVVFSFLIACREKLVLDCFQGEAWFC